jgi:hypothetical protein
LPTTSNAPGNCLAKFASGCPLSPTKYNEIEKRAGSHPTVSGFNSPRYGSGSSHAIIALTKLIVV